MLKILPRLRPSLSLAQTTAFSTQKLEIPFRAGNSSPSAHSTSQIGLFYTLPSDIKKQIFLNGGLPKSFERLVQPFTETCIMIRQPALDVISCLKTLDYAKPVVRFALYGRKGCGKSLTLAHILHYANENNFLIVHVPWVGNWMRRCKEYSNSPTREGCIDTPLDAAAWLVHFKNQNSKILASPELITSKEYVWSRRETTAKGTPLLSLVEHGINRIKFACDCSVVLLDEIKMLSSAGKCKTFVAIDGFNAFFHPNIRIKFEDKSPAHPSKITLTEGFLNITKFDWTNGVVVVTLDEIAASTDAQESHLPRYLLGKDGFEHLDPFVPIEVPDYSPKELLSCLEYFKDRRWIDQHPENEKELAFLSAHNPYTLMQLCSSV